MRVWLVTLGIEGKYWSVDIEVDSPGIDTAEAAMAQVQGRFDEAVAHRWAFGRFVAQSARQVERS